MQRCAAVSVCAEVKQLAALPGGPMAIPIFLILCGLSVGFLVYVLVQFWREEHRNPGGDGPVMVFSRSWNPNLVVVTHPISLSAHGGISVMPLQTQAPARAHLQDRGKGKARVLAMPAGRRVHEQRQTASGSRTKAR
jgi:hypothetical protein